MKKLKIGFVELYCGKSGKRGFYNSQELGMAKAMKRKGYTSVIFYPDTTISSIVEEIIEPYITIVYCPAKAIGVHSYYDWKVLLKYSIDVAQIGSDNQLFFPSLVKFCRINNIKFYNYIGTIESNSPGVIKGFVFHTLTRRNINIYKQSKCFAKTKAVFSQLQQKGAPDICLLPVGLDISIIPAIFENEVQIKRKLGIPLEKRIVIFVGRIDEYKRPFEIIKLMECLNDKFFFIIIGTGNLDSSLQDKLSNFPEECYLWIKQLPNSKIHEYYKISDYCVNFNESEIFGMSILEAMYHGCTVIARHAPGPDVIIQNSQSGWLVDDSTQTIALLTKDKKLCKETIQKRILNNFIWEKIIDYPCNWIEENRTEKI